MGELISPLRFCGQRTLVCAIQLPSMTTSSCSDVWIWDVRHMSRVLAFGIDLEPVVNDRICDLSCWSESSDDVLRIALALESGRIVATQLRPWEYNRRVHWECRTEDFPEEFSDFASGESLSESDYSEYMEQFSEADLCTQEIDELTIDKKNGIYIWRFDAVYPKKFAPMDPTSWKARQLMREFKVERWEEFKGEFDEDEDCPLRRIVGLYIDDQKMVSAVNERRGHEETMHLIGDRGGDGSNPFYTTPGEVVCWRLSLETDSGPNVNTCRYECAWKVQPFRHHLQTFAMSSCFLVMTGDDEDVTDCSEVLVWTVLPDPEGRLGFGAKGATRTDGAENDSDGDAHQQRLQYGPESDESGSASSTSDES